MGKSISFGVTSTGIQILPPPLACSELLLPYPSNMADPEVLGSRCGHGSGTG